MPCLIYGDLPDCLVLATQLMENRDCGLPMALVQDVAVIQVSTSGKIGRVS
jgi:hypothetical protein